MTSNAGRDASIRAGDVLDVPSGRWTARPWAARREAGPKDAAFCDVAASQALAKLAQAGGEQPGEQLFLAHGDLRAWRGEFSWGVAWCASRGEEFWAWAQGDGTADARMEIAGPWTMWDDELAEIFANSLAAGPVDAPGA